MLEKPLVLFTREEEEFVNLLIETGIHENIARILVYLAKTTEASFREIERGTDVSTPAVSRATKYLSAQGWIRCWRIPSEKKGRMFKKYQLAVPVDAIIADIERQKMTETRERIELVKKIRNYL